MDPIVWVIYLIHTHQSKKQKKMLGYNPSHNLKDGLKEAVEWYWGCFN